MRQESAINSQDTLTPRLVDDFVPHPLLRGGHAQTIASNFLPRRNALPAPEDRLFQVADGAQVLCHCHWQPDRTSRLTLIIVHGLEGSSASQYVIGTGSKAWLAGMNVVRMNMRNCGGTWKLANTVYHSGMSGDVGAVVEALIREERLPRIALAGFSMGGNLVMKLVGEWGSGAPSEVKAAATVSPAMDLGASCDELHRWENRIYEWRFLLSLYKTMGRKAQNFPEIFQPYRFSSVRSLREFDDKVTARYAGFTGAADYYERARSSKVADRIVLPTLVINSLDDPFIRFLPETREKLLANPHVHFIETRHGGHCAFIARATNGYDGRWAERKIIEFAQSIAN